MKAVQATERGGYEALRLVDIPRPQPQSGQARVRVTSAGVTPLDRTVLAGLLPSAKKPPLVPGNEGAGVIMMRLLGMGSRAATAATSAGPAQRGTGTCGCCQRGVPTSLALRQRCGPVGGEERAGHIAGAGGHEERDKGSDLGALGCSLH
jgi:D-arabinose 1-dehydrogenase-like Zn-dependent alcohol dehydrogenase